MVEFQIIYPRPSLKNVEHSINVFNTNLVEKKINWNNNVLREHKSSFLKKQLFEYRSNSIDKKQDLKTGLHVTKLLKHDSSSGSLHAKIGEEKSSLLAVKHNLSPTNVSNRSNLQSILDLKRKSTSPFYMNTYCLMSKRLFNVDRVKSILIKILNTDLNGAKYDPVESPDKISRLCVTIRRSVKELKFDRYKLVILVQIIEKRSQSVRMITSFLWNSDHDNYASATYENNSLYATAVVYGVYHE